MSLEASGAIFGAMVFRRGRSGATAYRLPAPPASNTASPSARQLATRQRYRNALTAYNALQPEEREALRMDAAADPRLVSGWNLFLERWPPLDGEPETPPSGPYTPPPLSLAIAFPSGSGYIPPPLSTAISFP